MSDPIESLPRLEPYPAHGAWSAPIYLRQFPFTIGRSEKSNLTIDSFRVSREHAVLLAEEGVYVLQDLRSTNGTFVNGRPADRVELNDGDVITFADVEYSFVAPVPPAPRYAVTQPLGGRSSSPHPSGPEAVAALRRFNEILLHGAAVRFEPIAELAAGQTVGYRLVPPAESPPWAPGPAERWLLAVECRLAQRVRDFHRRWAVEAAAALPAAAVILLPLAPADLEHPQLVHFLAELAAGLPAGGQLAVELPPAAAAASPPAGLVADLRRASVQTFADWTTAGAWLDAPGGTECPDGFKLPAAAARPPRGPSRAAGSELLMHRAGQRGVRLLATGVRGPDDQAQLRRLGCGWGLGPLFGEPLAAVPAARMLVEPQPLSVVS